MTDALRSLIEELERDRLLDEPNRLRERIEAIDRLEAHLICGQDPAHDAGSPDASRLSDRAMAICARLEALNGKLYQTIRCDIQRGAGPRALLEWIPELHRHRHAVSTANGEGYDYLDALVSGVLQFDEPGARTAPLAAEMVFYQPTPARHIFDLIGRGALTEQDVLIDLGSGLGHVPLLASICTRAHSVGIELEAAYVYSGRRCAQVLGLTNVTFVQQDARLADLSSGTMFYLYTPFTGALLRTVLDLLRQEATCRNIRVCTLGPCTATVAKEPWLESESVEAHQADRIAIFRSVNSES